MISEKTFASTFSSFWQEIAPTGEGFVRTMNLAKRHFNTPLKSRSDPQRRALINELGFLLFKESVVRATSPEAIFKSTEAGQEIANHAVSAVKRYQGAGENEVHLPNEEETKESLALARRLVEFLKENEMGASIALSPYFFGCGFIDNCAGDILVSSTLYEVKCSTLYEVKSGDRPFRLVDVRQMVMYLALNFISRKHHIDNAGFVNPRLGTFYKMTASELALGVSGKSLVDLMADITDFVSSGGVSR